MHSVASETFTIDAMVEQNMTIVSVVVPAFEVLFVLKVLLEFHQYTLTVGKVVDEESWSIAEVDVWADEARSTDADAVPNRRFLFGIDADCFSVPRVHPIGVILQNFDHPLSILNCSNNRCTRYI